MSFLEGGFLEGGFLDDYGRASSLMAARHPELLEGDPVPTAAQAAGLMRDPRALQLAGLGDRTVTLPFVNVALTYRQITFIVIVGIIAYLLWKEKPRRRRRGR